MHRISGAQKRRVFGRRPLIDYPVDFHAEVPVRIGPNQGESSQIKVKEIQTVALSKPNPVSSRHPQRLFSARDSQKLKPTKTN
jgi:hypothetical protein